jgi:hypothetical protein
MSKKRGTKKNGRTRKSEPTYYLPLTQSEAETCTRPSPNSCVASSRVLADMTMSDEYAPEHRVGALHIVKECNALDERVSGVVGYFENGYHDDPKPWQKLPITEARVRSRQHGQLRVGFALRTLHEYLAAAYRVRQGDSCDDWPESVKAFVSDSRTTQ